MAEPISATGSPIQLQIFDISQLTPEVGKSMIEAAKEYGFLYVASESSEFTNEEVENAFGMVYLSLLFSDIGSYCKGWSSGSPGIF